MQVIFKITARFALRRLLLIEVPVPQNESSWLTPLEASFAY